MVLYYFLLPSLSFCGHGKPRRYWEADLEQSKVAKPNTIYNISTPSIDLISLLLVGTHRLYI